MYAQLDVMMCCIFIYIVSINRDCIGLAYKGKYQTMNELLDCAKNKIVLENESPAEKTKSPLFVI